MKFYDCKTAPSPRRARIFIAEKGLDVETIEVDLGAGEQFGEAFRTLNPRCTVPVLELDDGTPIIENIGIAAYLEAAHPEPPLMGSTPKHKALIATWNARIEFEGLLPTVEAFRNRTKGLQDHAITGPKNYAQIPELAARGLDRVRDFLVMLDERLGEREYIAGDDFSFADITALCIIDFAARVKAPMGEDQIDLKRWYETVSARPSARL